MKRAFYLLILLNSSFCLSQEKNCADEILYSKIQTLEEAIYSTNLIEYYLSSDQYKKNYAKETVEELWNGMLKNCNELITKFPNSVHLFETLFQKASLEQSLGNTKMAKEYYEKVLSFETSNTELKNKSLRVLAYLLIEEKQYEKALVYLDQIKNFKISHDCGLAYETYKASLEAMYQKCHNGLGKK